VQDWLPGGQDSVVIPQAMVASVLAALDVTAEHWALPEADLDLARLFRRAADAIGPPRPAGAASPDGPAPPGTGLPAAPAAIIGT
jgi:hypothetical protein